jgi:hypothetical protein
MSLLFELRNVMDDNIRGFTFVSKVQEITDILKETYYEIMVARIYPHLPHQTSCLGQT